MGDGEEWEEHGEFLRTGQDSRDFFAWAVEGMASFKVTKTLTGRLALRYEELDPQATHALAYQRVVANLAIPVRMMRPALWPYVEVAENLVTDDTTAIFGVRMAF